MLSHYTILMLHYFKVLIIQLVLLKGGDGLFQLVASICYKPLACRTLITYHDHGL